MERRYTIEQLCEHLGVTRRMVRFYIQRKLLPPSTGRGRGGYYSERHIATFKEIVRLRKSGIRLKEITEYLESDLGEKVIDAMIRGVAVSEGANLGDILRIPPPGPESCIRFTVSSGVEILVRQKVRDKNPEKIQKLIEAAKKIFPEKDLSPQ